MNKGEVTRVRISFAAKDGSPYPFDTTMVPGYVWHGHLLDHEDGEMMRPFKLLKIKTDDLFTLYASFAAIAIGFRIQGSRRACIQL